jgi:hypothetical protein
LNKTSFEVDAEKKKYKFVDAVNGSQYWINQVADAVRMNK